MFAIVAIDDFQFSEDFHPRGIYIVFFDIFPNALRTHEFHKSVLFLFPAARFAAKIDRQINMPIMAAAASSTTALDLAGK